MKGLTKLIYGALVVLFTSSLMSPAMSQSELAGPYFGINAQTVGVELEGSHDATSTEDAKTSGNLGAFAMVAGIEAGWAIPVGENWMIDVGMNYIGGEASLKSSTSDGSAAADVTFEASDFITYYIAPTLSIGDNSSVYFK
jgi:hypothetical protein